MTTNRRRDLLRLARYYRFTPGGNIFYDYTDHGVKRAECVITSPYLICEFVLPMGRFDRVMTRYLLPLEQGLQKRKEGLPNASLEVMEEKRERLCTRAWPRRRVCPYSLSTQRKLKDFLFYRSSDAHNLNSGDSKGPQKGESMLISADCKRTRRKEKRVANIAQDDTMKAKIPKEGSSGSSSYKAGCWQNLCGPAVKPDDSGIEVWAIRQTRTGADGHLRIRNLDSLPSVEEVKATITRYLGTDAESFNISVTHPNMQKQRMAIVQLMERVPSRPV
ncbi:hypothetical protein J6590_096106 [Homalodisca vitripennis]|nr:hypothetical protein J6590_096106 [Homalodisca vitripennis]